MQISSSLVPKWYTLAIPALKSQVKFKIYKNEEKNLSKDAQNHLFGFTNDQNALKNNYGAKKVKKQKSDFLHFRYFIFFN